MQPKHFVAFDLGATSGRTILGSLRDGELVLKELTRFPNTILPLGGHYYWNIFSLYEHLCEGLRAAAFQADVADRAQVEDMVRRVEDTFGPVRLLVNNAGVAGQALFQDVTEEMWRRYFGVNIDGAFHTIQAVLPPMLHEHAGCIVNVSSMWGLRGASCEVTYSATKAALIALTRSLAAELAPTHIRVNCVAPGVIKTDMLSALPDGVLPQLAEETPLRRLGRPEDIAAAVSYLASDDASFVTGQVLTVDGGFIL